MTATSERSMTVGALVDYSQSLGQMIGAGCYDETSRDINPRNFRLEAVGCCEVQLTLVQFDYPMAPLGIVMLMRRRGYRPAVLEELLALGREHRDLQRSIPIVALGSARVVKNRRYVPCLGGSESTRTLTLVVIYRRWSNCYRFAFVRE